MFDGAYTSPLVRARQTAELVVARCPLARGRRLETVDELLNGTTAAGFRRWLVSLPDREAVLLVGHDMPLLTAGVVMLSLGMAMNVIVASLDVTAGNCADYFPATRMECGTAPFALVPLAGGVVLGTVHFHGDHIATAVPIVVGLSSLAPQILGLILTLVAVHGHTEDLVSRDVLAVLPWASAEGAGLALGGSW